MSLSYDVFTQAFLDKVTDYGFPIQEHERTGMIDRCMKRAIAEFKHICRYDFSSTEDDIVREFREDVEPEDIHELAEIISDGMVVQWLKPYVYHQENLQNMLNTRDFTTYSPANLLTAVRETCDRAKRDFAFKMREYSYNHGDLTDLHL